MATPLLIFCGSGRQDQGLGVGQSSLLTQPFAALEKIGHMGPCSHLQSLGDPFQAHRSFRTKFFVHTVAHEFGHGLTGQADENFKVRNNHNVELTENPVRKELGLCQSHA